MKFYQDMKDKITKLTPLESSQSEVYNLRYDWNNETVSERFLQILLAPMLYS
jgi:hypothetical protein